MSLIISTEPGEGVNSVHFHVGQVFATYNEFEKFRDSFEKNNSTELWIRTTVPSQDPDQKYKHITLCCKAGGRDYRSKSKFRSGRSYKQGCPYRINIGIDRVSQFLKVSSMVENHTCKLAGNKMVFESLPKQRRLDEEQKNFVLDVKACNGNTKSLIAKLKESYGKIVAGKDIVNLIRKSKRSDQTELERLVTEMQSYGQSSVMITEENNQVNTIFFQDSSMHLLFEEYPEILFCDATYKTNENRMALMVFMIVDGNGESGLVGLCFIKSESEKCTLSALESLKKCCPSHEKTRVIMADKDMANRSAFKKAFPSAEMSICIFHTIQSFSREVTCSKRNLTIEKREEALKIMKQMVYSDCSKTYNILYEKLKDLDSPELMQYFNDNWHDKIEQWTLYGQSASAPFLNRTNNRIERFNRELHDTVKKYSNIADAFHNLMIACNAHRSERHLRALSMVYKIQNTLEDPVERDYRNILTKFAADKVMEQVMVSERLLERIVIGEEETRMKIGNQVLVIDESMCQCNFFVGMRLPCRHILTLMRKKDDDLFLPELCDRRWYLEKFEDFKKKENSIPKNILRNDDSGNEAIPLVTSENHTRIVNLTENQKFREIRDLTLGLAEICSKQRDEVYDLIKAEIENFSTGIIDFINGSHTMNTIERSVDDETSRAAVTQEVMPVSNNIVMGGAENDLDRGLVLECICGFNDIDSNLSKMGCCHCQKNVHNVCYGILDGFSDEYNSKLDPYLKFGCHRCPQEKYSDRTFLKLERKEIARKVLIRAALKSIVMNSIIFPRESNLIKPIVDFLRERRWYELLPILFQTIDEDPDVAEICSFRYELPDDSINIEIPGHGHVFNHDGGESFDLEELNNFIELNSENASSSKNSEPLNGNRERIPSQNHDHQYYSQLKKLELPPVLVNVRTTKGKSRSTRKTRLKIFAALRTIEKRKRMTVWLFGEAGSKSIINGSAKISCDDLKKIDNLTWQKFRNEIVDRGILVCLFEDDAWIEFDGKISEMNRKKKSWLCRNCKKSLNQSDSILCDRCMDWIHLICVGLSSVPRRKTWMCPDCSDEE